MLQITNFVADWKQPYKPATATNKQLADDWRLFVAAVANLDAGKDEPYSYKDIYKWAADCAKEIAKRAKTGKMSFSISKQKSAPYKKLCDAVFKKLETWELSILTESLDSSKPPKAIILVSPHAELAATGKKTLIVKSRDFSGECEKALAFCSGDLCFGTLKMKLPRKVPKHQLEELYPLHRITPAEIEDWWPDKNEFYLYDIYDVSSWDVPRHADIPQGPQTFVNKYELSDSQHRRDKCMECNKPPEFEVLWAEGIAHAWFCEKHLKEWVKKSAETCLREGYSNLNCELDAIKKIDNGEASKHWKDNKNPNILDRILHGIKPDVDFNLLDKTKKEEERRAVAKSIGLRDAEERALTAFLNPSKPSNGELNEELSKKDCANCDLEICSKECFDSHPGSLIALKKLLHSFHFEVYTSADSKVEQLAPVNPSGVELGEEITLKEIKPFFKSFYRTKPYVSLVGGLCTQGETEGDIDIFIRSAYRDIATEFRIVRMFPQKYWFRFQFHYPYEQETHPGVFTNYMDIFNEKIEVVSEPELVLMSVPKKVELFKFAKLLKPTVGKYEKGEEYTIDNLINVVNANWDYTEKIAVQRKYDGWHVRCDCKEGEVKIYTEEGNEITDKCPTIVSEFKEICKGHDVVVTGELESWEKGKHNPRQKLTSIIHSKGVHEDEKTLKLNMFDCLYYN